MRREGATIWPLFLVLPVFHVPFFYDAGASRWALLYAAIGLWWLAAGDAGWRRLAGLGWRAGLVAAPAGYALAATQWAASPQDALAAALQWTALAMVALAAMTLDGGEIRRCWAVFAAGVAVSAGLAVGETAGWTLPFVTVISAPAGLFQSRNWLAEACVLALAAPLWIGRRQDFPISAWWPLPLLLAGIAVTASLNAWCAVAVLALLAAWRGGWRWTAGLTALAAAVAALWIARAGLLPHWDMVSLEARLALWRGAADGFAWAGQGGNSLAGLWPLLAGDAPLTVKNFGVAAATAHNDAVTLIFEFGAGAALWLALAAVALREGWKHDDSGSFWALAAGLALGLGAYPLYTPVGAAGMALACGACLGAGVRARADAGARRDPARRGAALGRAERAAAAVLGQRRGVAGEPQRAHHAGDHGVAHAGAVADGAPGGLAGGAAPRTAQHPAAVLAGADPADAGRHAGGAPRARPPGGGGAGRLGPRPTPA